MFRANVSLLMAIPLLVLLGHVTDGGIKRQIDFVNHAPSARFPVLFSQIADTRWRLDTAKPLGNIQLETLKSLSVHVGHGWVSEMMRLHRPHW
jgi:hypothetical protein